MEILPFFSSFIAGNLTLAAFIAAFIGIRKSEFRYNLLFSVASVSSTIYLLVSLQLYSAVDSIEYVAGISIRLLTLAVTMPALLWYIALSTRCFNKKVVYILSAVIFISALAGALFPVPFRFGEYPSLDTYTTAWGETIVVSLAKPGFFVFSFHPACIIAGVYMIIAAAKLYKRGESARATILLISLSMPMATGMYDYIVASTNIKSLLLFDYGISFMIVLMGFQITDGIIRANRIERALAASNDKFTALLHQTYSSFVLLNRSGEVLAANNTAKQFLLKKNTSLQNKKIWEMKTDYTFSLPDDEMEEIFHRACKSEAYSGEVSSFKNGIKERAFSVLVQPICIENSRDVRFILIEAHDITHEKQLKADVSQAGSAETVSTLVGGFAHEFNNLLATILGHADLLQDSSGVDKEEDISAILSAGEKAKYLVSEIVSYVKKGPAGNPPFDLSRGVKKTQNKNRKECLGGHERILLVDDDATILHIHSRLLQSLGYEVAMQNNPLKALELLCEDPDGFDLVISDYDMPEMDGLSLAQSISESTPGTAVLICTAYGDLLTEEKLQASGAHGMITKPVSRQGINDSIRKVLGLKKS